MAGLNMVHVPYRGAAPAMNDLIPGRMHLLFSGGATLDNARSGQVQVLGYTGAKRSAIAPAVPTIAEDGVPGFNVVAWYGFFVPVKTSTGLSRAPNAARKSAPREGPPGVFFICTKGGRGGAGPDPHTNHSRNFRLEDPPQFFGQIFWEKILEIKSVLLASPRRGCYASSRSDSAAIGVVLHRWSLSRRDPFAASRVGL